jgi:two-component system, NtrC family, response regulator HydG
VLVVDDDPEMRLLLRDVLEQSGCEVIEESSGADALRTVEPGAFDVVIVDKHMPGISGLDFLTLLRRHQPALPVILITAFGGSDVAAQAFARGATRYMEKPFRVTDLVAVVRAIVAERGGIPGAEN